MEAFVYDLLIKLLQIGWQLLLVGFGYLTFIGCIRKVNHANDENGG